MKYMTSGPMMYVRRIVRRIGISPKFLESKLGINRETQFRERLLATARPGDVVWDMGAAWGGVSAPLSERVGASGVVVAFEPNDQFLGQLRDKQKTLPNLMIVDKAVGSVKGTLTSNTNNLRVGGKSWESSEKAFEITTGDAAAYEDSIPVPNVIKVDVEGLELEVIQGCRKLLQDPKVRAIFIEVHFRILDETGRSGVPAEIVDFLEGAGFRTEWVDSSHLAALRP